MTDDSQAEKTPRSLRDWYEAALDVAPELRTAWLVEHCPNPTLLERIMRLLTAGDDSSAASPLPARTPSQLALDMGEIQTANVALENERVGPYLLRGVIGEGGSATVFSAERDLDGVPQQLAVKLLHRTMHTPESRRAFRRERQALTRLSHPNIARIIDGGVTEHGLAYLAIELVKGQRIDHYAAHCGLDFNARLRLIVVVCRAVASAHRLLIVHRDLKPSNILVDEEGQVKLLDFGIAKLLSDDPEEAEQTQTGCMQLTPAYAAPEQFNGSLVSTAIDVYSLGVILHELLIGLRPDPKSVRLASQFAKSLPHVGANAAQAKSSAKDKAELRAALQGDIDNILLKALDVDPARRYANAAELADDLERHLAHRPVRASRPSRWYLAAKFVRRHRNAVAMSVLLTISILGGAGGALWQAHQAKQQERIALAQAARADAVQQFIEALFDSTVDGRPTQIAPTIQDLIERGLKQLETAELGDPLVQADLLSLFARLNSATGANKHNVELAQRALDAQRKSRGQAHAKSRDAQLIYARVLRRSGALNEARAAIEQLVNELRRAGVRGMPLASALDELSLLRMDQGVGGLEAVALKREVLEERERDPSFDDEQRKNGYNNLGVAYQYAGAFPEALIWYRKGLEINQRLQPISRATATSYLNIGMTESFQGRPLAALENLNQARVIFAAIPLHKHPHVATLMTRICAVTVELEHFEAARSACDEAVEVANALAGTSQNVVIHAHLRRAAFYFSAGLIAQGKAELANARAGNARSQADAGYNENLITTVEIRQFWVESDFVAMRDAGMRLLLGESPLEKRGFQPSVLAAYAAAALGCARAPTLRCDLVDANKVERWLVDPRYAQSVQRLPALIALSDIAALRGEHQSVIARLKSAPEIFAPALGSKHSLIGQAQLRLARAYSALGEQEPARRHLEQARMIAMQLPVTHPFRQEVNE